jgi:hypothetical protein
LGPLLGACSKAENVQEALGYEQKGPDEMAVIKRPPLILPPDYNLRPPRPGDRAAASRDASEAARATLLGESTAAAGTRADTEAGARALLTNGAAGATGADAASAGQNLLVDRTDRTDGTLDQLTENRDENRVDSALLRRLLAWTPDERPAPEGENGAAGENGVAGENGAGGEAGVVRVVSRSQTVIAASPAPASPADSSAE